MDEKRKKEIFKISKEAEKQFKEHRLECSKEILKILKKRKLHPVTSYHILNKIIEEMERRDPFLKMAKVMSKEIERRLRQKLQIGNINIIESVRQTNKRWLGKNKASIIVCGKYPINNSEKVKCKDCGSECYHTNENKDMVKKNAKLICGNCILTKKKYRKGLNSEQLELLKNVWGDKK